MTKPIFTINGKPAEHGKLYELMVSEGKYNPDRKLYRIESLSKSERKEFTEIKRYIDEQVYGIPAKRTIKQRLSSLFESFMERIGYKKYDQWEEMEEYPQDND